MKKSSVKPKEYKYTELKSIKANTTVDIYGVVKFLKHPFKTRGRDYCMVVSLVDPSFDKEEKLKCLLFNNDPAKLPELKIGDIVRFHRLKINVFHNEFQGQSGPGFSWIVFPNEEGAGFDSLSTCSSNYTFTDTDKGMVTELRKWSAGKEDLSKKNNTIAIEDIVPQMYFDLACQVVATCYFEEENCFAIRVWDGTMTIYQIRKFSLDEDRAVACCESLLRKSDKLQVDIALYDDHCENARNKFKPGDMVKIVNLHAAIYKNAATSSSDIPMLELVLHRGNSFGRGIMLVNDDNLAENLSNAGNLTTEKMDSIKADNNNGKKGKMDIREKCGEKIVADSQRPSTSKQGDTNKGESSKQGDTNKGESSKQGDTNKGESSKQGDTNKGETSKQGDKNKGENYKPNSFSVSEKSDQETNIHVHVVSSTSQEEKQLADVQDYQQMEVDAEISDKTATVPSSGSRCMQQTVTFVMGHPHIKVTNIVDVLKSPAPNKFRILGHVKNFFPRVNEASKFLKLYCGKCNFLSSIPGSGKDFENFSVKKIEYDTKHYICPVCEKKENSDKSNNTLHYIYMMRFEIADETGSLEFLMWGKDAIRFFRDIDPIDLLCSESLWHELQEDLDQLCSTNKPLFECCIQSYCVEQQTKYQIFDTSLV